MFKNFLIPKSIFLPLVLVFILTILRVILFNRYSLVYILWNLLLAFIPFIVSLFIVYLKKIGKLRDVYFIILGIIWLLFLPNAPYIVTDLIHIGVVRSVPVLYDSVLLFTSAWLGLLLGLNSIFHVEKVLLSKYSKKTTNIIILIILLLISFGIYLGRFLRFNSWDILTNPISFFNKLLESLSTSSYHVESLIYIILFFSFLFVSYFSWKISRNE